MRLMGNARKRGREREKGKENSCGGASGGIDFI